MIKIEQFEPDPPIKAITVPADRIMDIGAPEACAVWLTGGVVMLRCSSRVWGRRIAVFLLVQLFAFTSLAQDDAEAKRKKSRHAYNPPYAAIVIDANTGKALYQSSPDAERYPASLTKMMTLYMLFDALEDGRVTKSTRMTTSARAAAQAPSKLALKPGQSIAVEDAILALVTKSANDVAMIIAEHLAGSESAFARQMTAKARALGMSKTTFKNASGLPDDDQKTTARDMAKLGEALIRNHPKHYRYFSTRSYTYKGKTYRNHNRLLGRVNGVDGIKTGYINASGFNLTTSARRGKKHLIAVVMGGKTGRARDAHMAGLLTRYFPKAADHVPAIAKAEVPIPPARPVTVTYSQMPAVNSAMEQSPPAPTPDVLRAGAGAVTLHSQTQTIASRQTTIIMPAGAMPRIAPDAHTTDAIAKMLKEQWLIQIGAYNDEPSAKAMLEQARQEIGALDLRLAYTEPVKKNDDTLWRARFSGFDKGTALTACERLKKANFKCLPLRQ